MVVLLIVYFSVKVKTPELDEWNRANPLVMAAYHFCLWTKEHLYTVYGRSIFFMRYKSKYYFNFIMLLLLFRPDVVNHLEVAVYNLCTYIRGAPGTKRFGLDFVLQSGIWLWTTDVWWVYVCAVEKELIIAWKIK